MRAQQNIFVGNFFRFLELSGVTSGPFWVPKLVPRDLIFGVFSKKRDFLKIVLPLWWEHNFEGSEATKIGLESDSERHRRKNCQKVVKNIAL